MALSRKFLWVRVDRDRTPELPRRFGVTAYPTLLTLGPKEEKIHRFSGFKKPPEFRAQLEDALRRLALYRKGRPWDEPEPRPASDAAVVETFPAPSEEIPSGLAFAGGALWIAQQRKIRVVDLASGKTAREIDSPPSVIDLCTDGRRVYALDYGWTAGRPIHVLDLDGKPLRTIVTEANRKNRAFGAKGIAWRDKKLWVLAGMRGVLHEVDPESGAVTRRVQTEGRWLAGLAFDGARFVCGSRDTLWWFDPETGKAVRKRKVNYPLRSVAYRDGSYYLMEQPVFGHDTHHARVRVWPKKMLVHKLTLRR